MLRIYGRDDHGVAAWRALHIYSRFCRVKVVITVKEKGHDRHGRSTNAAGIEYGSDRMQQSIRLNMNSAAIIQHVYTLKQLLLMRLKTLT